MTTAQPQQRSSSTLPLASRLSRILRSQSVAPRSSTTSPRVATRFGGAAAEKLAPVTSVVSEEEWYIPYNGPYEPPKPQKKRKELQHRDSWGDPIDEELHRRYTALGGDGEHYLGVAANGNGNGNGRGRRSRGLTHSGVSDTRTVSSGGAVDPSVHNAKMSKQQPGPQVPSGAGGIGESPMPTASVPPKPDAGARKLFSFHRKSGSVEERYQSVYSQMSAERAVSPPMVPVHAPAPGPPVTRGRQRSATVDSSEDYYNSYYSQMSAEPSKSKPNTTPTPARIAAPAPTKIVPLPPDEPTEPSPHRPEFPHVNSADLLRTRSLQKAQPPPQNQFQNQNQNKPLPREPPDRETEYNHIHSPASPHPYARAAYTNNNFPNPPLSAPPQSSAISPSSSSQHPHPQPHYGTSGYGASTLRQYHRLHDSGIATDPNSPHPQYQPPSQSQYQQRPQVTVTKTPTYSRQRVELSPQDVNHRLLKNSVSVPNLRDNVAGSSSKSQSSSSASRWLSAETWCDAILFPRPRLKLGASGRIVSPPGSPLAREFTNTSSSSSNNNRGLGMESRVLAHSRSVGDLAFGAGIGVGGGGRGEGVGAYGMEGVGAYRERDPDPFNSRAAGSREGDVDVPPRTETRTAPVPVLGRTRSGFERELDNLRMRERDKGKEREREDIGAAKKKIERPPRPKSFAMDDLALPSPVPSLAQVLQDTELLTHQRKQWQTQAQGSLANKRSRTLSRSRARTLSKSRNAAHAHARRPSTAGDNAANPGVVTFLAERALLGNQDFVRVTPRDEGTGTRKLHKRSLSKGTASQPTHSNGNSISKSHSLDRSRSTSHSRNSSWGRNAIKVATAKMCVDVGAGEGMSPAEEQERRVYERQQVLFGAALRDERDPGAGMLSVPGPGVGDGGQGRPESAAISVTESRMGIAVSTPMPTPSPEFDGDDGGEGGEREREQGQAIQIWSHPYAAMRSGGSGSGMYYGDEGASTTPKQRNYAGPHPTVRHRMPPGYAVEAFGSGGEGAWRNGQHPYAAAGAASPSNTAYAYGSGGKRDSYLSEGRVIPVARADSRVSPTKKMWAALSPGGRVASEVMPDEIGSATYSPYEREFAVEREEGYGRREEEEGDGDGDRTPTPTPSDVVFVATQASSRGEGKEKSIYDTLGVGEALYASMRSTNRGSWVGAGGDGGGGGERDSGLGTSEDQHQHVYAYASAVPVQTRREEEVDDDDVVLVSRRPSQQQQQQGQGQGQPRRYGSVQRKPVQYPYAYASNTPTTPRPTDQLVQAHRHDTSQTQRTERTDWTLPSSISGGIVPHPHSRMGQVQVQSMASSGIGLEYALTGGGGGGGLGPAPRHSPTASRFVEEVHSLPIPPGQGAGGGPQRNDSAGSGSGGSGVSRGGGDSPEVQPKPLGSVDDLGEFENLFYHPRNASGSTSTSSGEMLRRGRLMESEGGGSIGGQGQMMAAGVSTDAFGGGGDVGVREDHDEERDRDREGSAPLSSSVRTRTGSGLTSLARQLNDEFAEMNAEIGSLAGSFNNSSGRPSHDQQRAVHHRQRDDEIFEVDREEEELGMRLTPEGPQHPHPDLMPFHPTSTLPEDVDVESSRASSVVDMELTTTEEGEMPVYRIGNVEAVRTPPAESSHRRYSSTGETAYFPEQLNHPEPSRIITTTGTDVLPPRDSLSVPPMSAATLQSPSSHDSLSVPPQSAVTRSSSRSQPPGPGSSSQSEMRSSYMTHTSDGSRMSGLSDFPVPPAHMSLIGTYFREDEHGEGEGMGSVGENAPRQKLVSSELSSAEDALPHLRNRTVTGTERKRMTFGAAGGVIESESSPQPGL